ncbi:MAG: hypothetical protein KIT87_18075 [Anaerolineae bacterium]|nr:hypothetical protein [Anaerolineae bacterium]
MLETVSTPAPAAERPSRAIHLTPNARLVLTKRYLRRGEDGKPIETVEQMFERISRAVATPDAPYGTEDKAEARFFDLLTSLRFFPNSPAFTGAGTPLGQLAACFVLPIDDDMGKDANGIFQTLRNAALIQQTGGGNGFSFSRLRPKNDFVATSAGTATGPVGFLRVYDKAFGEIAQGGSRRGANMGVLRVDHPDVMDFIRCKADEGQITNFNISVALTDSFMQAVKDDTDFDLVNPRDGKVWKTMRARDIFAEIVKYAHRNGEPGCLFIDAANRTNPVPHLYELESTNPCVTGDSLVATPDGWRRADEIREGDEICTVLGMGRVASIEVHPDMPVYNVHLSDGALVCVTAAHQFHVRDSRTKFFEPRRLDQLKPGDWVRVGRTTLPNNPVRQGNVVLDDHAYGFLVGVLVGDGCYTPHALSKNVVRLSSHADDEEWNTILQGAFGQVGVEKVYTYVNEGSRSLMMDPKPGRVIAEWVRSLPLTPARGPEKTLPDCYVNSNREFLTGLLDGLFSTDGSVDLSTNHPLLRFHTSSEKLAQQLRRILLMFGVHGRIAKSTRQRHAIEGREVRYDRPKYDVLISGSSLGRFVEQIRLSHPEKQRRLEEATLRCNHTGGNWAAKVVRIEPAGTATVYDLYEPRTDTWITEGYVSRGCGEQWLGPYENCCLGSINLAQHFLDMDGRRVVDWEKLRRSVEEATHFLDNVVTANKYVPAVPELREAALRARRIGLGIMGLGDLMYALGVRYGSRAGEDFAGQIMEFVRYHCMKTSVELAKQRGPFTAIQGSIYDPQDLKWRPPTPLQPYTHDWGRPAVDWDAIVQGIQAHGIRNAAQTTIAPTGTIATVAGCEGYGCEPVFALAYIRHVKDPNGGPDIDLTYASPLFEQALKEAGVGEAARQRIYDKALNTGTCQDIPEVPASVRDTFVVASDITPEEHVRMQAAMQGFVDNSLSKTCNFPEGATVDDVARVYMLAWELGCKGLTVYVTGSREDVVLETKQTLEAKKSQNSPTLPVVVPQPRERQSVLSGRTYRMETPIGTAYVTVNDLDGEPYEVFINVGKGGSDIAAVSEALGRLCSLELQTPSPLGARERAKEIVHKLRGIAGSNSVGFGPNRVASLPDAIAVALYRHIGAEPEQAQQLSLTTDTTLEPVASYVNGNGQSVHRDICPECGQASLVFEEGCRHCSSCGYSKC